mmetsp:Transcript_41978/g.65588  ORF Transcript_41978/g.65588 Transcript_41978/m.65588 type:complete len:874 (+) Transcript_41978:1691-4312(+)
MINQICINYIGFIPLKENQICKKLFYLKKNVRRIDEKNLTLINNRVSGNFENDTSKLETEGKIIPTDLQSEMSKSYMEYAMSVIYGRALPDVRDGLKPVHRRILFAMFDLGLKHLDPYKKCARVVGEVLGKYHPHGDSAVYDALVRMAQDFSMRSSLIDGHGNFGSIDHDPAAAMRYTECRLSKFSDTCFINSIENMTVDFINNFDGTTPEPNVLPACLPVLLLNGSNGIAVGMATNTPPHNLTDISLLVLRLLENPFENDRNLLKIFPGPDFPTGGTIVGFEGCKNLFKGGIANMTIRGSAFYENFDGNTKGSNPNIILYELPFQLNKPSLVSKVATLINEKILQGVLDLRDESGRDGIRVVLELKKSQHFDMILNNIFKKTPLQSSFKGNILTIVDTKPETLSVREVVIMFNHFRRNVVRRKMQYHLGQIVEKNHLIDGLSLTIDSLEIVLGIIRSSENNYEAKVQLMEYGLTQDQSEAILNIQLRRLTKLESKKLNEESSNMKKELFRLKKILFFRKKIDQEIKKNILEILDKFGMRRRSKIAFSENKGSIEEIEMVENFRTILIISKYYIKRLILEDFESQRRGTKGKKGGEINNNDAILDFFVCYNHDRIIFFSGKGIAFSLMAYRVPISSRTSKGLLIDKMIPGLKNSFISSALPLIGLRKNEFLILLTQRGLVKKLPIHLLNNLSGRGLIVMNLNKGDWLAHSSISRTQDEILISTKNGRAIRFSTNDNSFRATGRLSKGVKSIKLSKNDEIACLDINRTSDCSLNHFLIITEKGFGKKIKTEEMKIQKRGGMGLLVIKFKKNSQDYLQSCKFCSENDEFVIVSKQGIILRQVAKSIPSQGRYGKGVRVQKLGENDRIKNISIISN